jgi:predicted nucleic acid-binding protein
VAGHVLDTSAIITYLYDEEGADTAEEVIFGHADPVLLPFIALMEVEYQLIRDREDVDERIASILDWPVRLIESDEQWRRLAATVKAPGRISVADAWVASLALLRDAALVHKDPEFDAVTDLQHLRLPYRRGRR